MDRIVNDGLPLPGPDFTPIVGIAMVQITSPNERFVLPQAVIPFTSGDLMRGLFAKSANGGFRVERKTMRILMNLGFVSSPNLSSAVSTILRGRTPWTTPDTSWIVNNVGIPIQTAARHESNRVSAERTSW